MRKSFEHKIVIIFLPIYLNKSLRRFFWVPTTYVLDEKIRKIIFHYTYLEAWFTKMDSVWILAWFSILRIKIGQIFKVPIITVSKKWAWDLSWYSFTGLDQQFFLA